MNTKTLNTSIIRLSYNLIADRTAHIVFRNCSRNETYSLNIDRYSDDIGALSDAILELINVGEFSDGKTYEDYMAKMFSGNCEKTNDNESYFTWDNFESEFDFELKPVNEKVVRICIKESCEARGRYEQNMFECNTNLLDFAENVVQQMEIMLSVYGFQGYYDRWGYEFPARSYLKLKSYVVMGRKTGTFKKTVPNINIPFELEMKLLKKLTEAASDSEEKDTRNSR